jgi:hypothetical protein
MKPRENVILRYAPVLTSTLLSLFALDGVAKPLKRPRDKDRSFAPIRAMLQRNVEADPSMAAPRVVLQGLPGATTRS